VTLASGRCELHCSVKSLASGISLLRIAVNRCRLHAAAPFCITTQSARSYFLWRNCVEHRQGPLQCLTTLDGRGSIPAEAKDSSSSLCVQTGSEVHPASYPVSTGGRGVILTTQPHLVPRSRVSSSYISPPHCRCMAVAGQLCSTYVSLAPPLTECWWHCVLWSLGCSGRDLSRAAESAVIIIVEHVLFSSFVARTV
jgi:hypothetical protein